VASKEQVEAVRAAVAPVVDALGLRLYDVELSGSGAGRVLRVTVASDGGLDLDAITRATQAISPVVDGEPALAGPYLLEVSSPGVERALRRPEHYLGARGEQVSIKYHTESGPQRVHGVLLDADDARCVVDVDGASVDIAYDHVTSARTVFEWGAQPRPGAPSTRGRSKGRARAAAKERS
jgi:ribosome maturation factor RimP